MKTFLLRVGAFLVFFSLPVFAEIIGVERFDYPDSDIAGKSGGVFWDWKNVSPVGHTGVPSNWDNVFGSPAVVAGRLVTDNGGAKREYNGADEGQGAVNGANVNKAVYYRVTVTTGAAVPAFFGLSSYDFGAERVFIGKRFAQPNFGVEIIGGDADNSGIAIEPDTSYTLVARIDYAAETIRLYVDPNLAAGEPATPAASVSWENTEWSTGVRLASGSGGAVSWDNLVVATTWEALRATGIVVTTTADEDDGSLGGGAGVSLREAVNHSPNGALITFAPGLNGQTITLTLGQIAIPDGKTLTIDASALPQGVTLHGNNASRLFLVEAGRTLTLRSLTLTGGNADLGGAVNNSGSLTLAGCTLMGNHSSNSG